MFVVTAEQEQDVIVVVLTSCLGDRSSNTVKPFDIFYLYEK